MKDERRGTQDARAKKLRSSRRYSVYLYARLLNAYTHLVRAHAACVRAAKPAEQETPCCACEQVSAVCRGMGARASRSEAAAPSLAAAAKRSRSDGADAPFSACAADERIVWLVLSSDGLTAADVAAAACVSRAWRRASAQGWRALWRREMASQLATEAAVAARPGGFRAALAQLRCAELAGRGPKLWSTAEDYQLAADVTWKGRPIASAVVGLSTPFVASALGFGPYLEGHNLLPPDSAAARDFSSACVAAGGLPHYPLLHDLRLKLYAVRRDGALAALPLDSPRATRRFKYHAPRLELDEHGEYRLVPPSQDIGLLYTPPGWRWDCYNEPDRFGYWAADDVFVGINVRVFLKMENDSYAGAPTHVRVHLTTGLFNPVEAEAVSADGLLMAMWHSLQWVQPAGTQPEEACITLAHHARAEGYAVVDAGADRLLDI